MIETFNFKKEMKANARFQHSKPKILNTMRMTMISGVTFQDSFPNKPRVSFTKTGQKREVRLDRAVLTLQENEPYKIYNLYLII